jgi:hypothetical protein
MSSTRKGVVANVILGLALVVFGVLLLLEAVFRVDVWGLLWPLFVLGPGLMLFAVMLAKGRGHSGGLAVPACIVTTVGLILFVQNLLNMWATWAYAWTLVAPTSLGAGLLIEGWWNGDGRRRAEGRRTVTAGVTAFVVLGAFFELALNLSGWVPRVVSRLLGPLVFIALGTLLLLRALLFPRGRHPAGVEFTKPGSAAPYRGPDLPPMPLDSTASVAQKPLPDLASRQQPISDEPAVDGPRSAEREAMDGRQ